jgi:hypothetical protein
VLLFEASYELQLRLKLGKQPFSGFDGIVGRIQELGKELYGFRRTGVNELPDRRHFALM